MDSFLSDSNPQTKGKRLLSIYFYLPIIMCEKDLRAFCLSFSVVCQIVVDSDLLFSITLYFIPLL